MRGHDVAARPACGGVDSAARSHKVPAVRAIILAAGRGNRLAPLTDDRPKPLVEVLGRSLLLRTIDRLREVGIADGDVVIVTGYRAEMIEAVMRQEELRCELVYNPRWHDWNNFNSLLVARDRLRGAPFLQFDGDVVFDGRVLPRVLAAPGGAALTVEVAPMPNEEAMKAVVDADGVLLELSKTLDPRRAIGEYVGITRLDVATGEQVFDDLARFEAEGITHEYYDHAYHRLAVARAARFGIVDIADCEALEVDALADLQRAEARLRSRASA